ncbi:carbon storage regulator CsrA [Desulfomarina sp.]
MLVLTRKTGEGILIGDDIILKVIECKSGAVRIGIDAPRNKNIYRQEVYDRIVEENRNAAQWDIADLDILVDISSGRKEK